MKTPSLRIGTANDAELVTDILVDAFAADLMIDYLLAGHSQREAAHRALAFADIRYHWFPHGEVVISEDDQGAMLWKPPGAEAPSRWNELLFQVVFLRAVGWRRGLRFQRESKQAAKHAPWEHGYVGFLGVRQDWQGQGIGSALLRHAQSTCDAQGVGMYLETSNPRNLALYERFGFAIVDKARVGRRGPEKWFMWRQSPLPGGPAAR